MHDTQLLRRGWLALLWLWPLPVMAEASGLDLWLEDFYFDPVSRRFPWQHVLWFNLLVHDGLLTALILCNVALGGLLVLTLCAPTLVRAYLPPAWCRPRLLLYLLVAMLAGPVLVGLLKQVSARPCPWSLALYGGHAPYLPLLDGPLFDPAVPGKCFPGAHASGGFGLLAFVPLLHGRRRRCMLVLALSVGLAMGWTRMMQGAHFLSHNLWSAWLCWLCVLISYALLRPGRLA